MDALSRRPQVASYTIMDIVGDMICLVGALGAKQAIIVGHDWGAAIAWHAALFRPEVFPAVAALSVPFRPRGSAPPLEMLRKAGLTTHYWFHFQEPGVAEAEFERDPRAALRRVLYSISGDAPRETRELTLYPGKGWLANTLDPEQSACLVDGRGPRSHDRGIFTQRISRRPQLVPQHRSELGTHRALDRRIDSPTGPVHRRQRGPRHRAWLGCRRR